MAGFLNVQRRMAGPDWYWRWASAGVLALGCVAALGQPEELFSDAPSERIAGTIEDAFPDPRLVSRARRVHTSRSMLDTARAGVLADGAARLSLNLFDDAVFGARIDAAYPTAGGGYALSGTLADMEFGRATLVANAGTLAGAVHTPTRSFVIRQRPGEPASIAEVDFSLLPGCGFDAFHAANGQRRERSAGRAMDPQGPGASRPGLPLLRPSTTSSKEHVHPLGSVGATPNGQSILDVAVLYTRGALNAAGGHDLIAAEVDLAVVQANAAFADSGVNLRVRIAFAGELDAMLPDPAITQGRTASEMVELFTGGWSVTQVSARSADGTYYETAAVADRINAMRDAFGADVLHIVGHGNCAGCAGLAEFLGVWAFTEYTALGAHVFVHELGHNLGLLHDRYVDAGNPAFPGGHGYVNQAAFAPDAPPSARWRTIMAYDTQCRVQGRFGCALAPVFSDPERMLRGHRRGWPGEAHTDAPVGPANARRVLEQTRGAAAALRTPTETCPVTVTPSNPFTRARGGRFTLRVTTPPECRWSAVANAPFLSTGGGERRGPGTVEYEVAANAGPLRSGDLQVAGQIIAVQQAAAPGPGVCDRAPGIREALVEVAGTTSCAEVTAAQVAAVDRLTVVVRDLADEDLAGFTGLHGLRLGVAAGPLPAAPFADLADLEMLALWGDFQALPRVSPTGMPRLTALDVAGPLSQLPSDAFRGLPALRRLSLGHMRLEALPAGTLHGLTALTTLELRRGRLAGLHADALANLSALETVDLSGNRLRHLTLGVFDGLLGLTTLDLRDNALGTVPQNLFADLPSLEWLHLAGNGLRQMPRSLRSLPKLRALGLGGNRIERVSGEDFRGLSELEFLDLSGNLLHELPADAFADSPVLDHLDLELNGIETLPAALFHGMPQLWELYLAFNNLTELPDTLFADLHLGFLTLHRNPGAPFAFPARLEVSDAAPFPSDEKTVIARLARPAPFFMEVQLTASNAVLSPEVTYLGRSLLASEPAVAVMPGRGRAVTVSAHVAPWYDCNPGSRLASCPTGVSTPAGPSLEWFKHHQRIESGAPARFDLTRMFETSGGAKWTYAAVLDDPGLATVTVADGMLTVTTNEDGFDGDVQLTVTATNADGRTHARRFLLQIETAGRSFLRGWRRTLLIRPGEEAEGD